MRLILCAVALVLAGCATKPAQEQMESADYGPPPTNYTEAISAYMANRLRDPESARYEHLTGPKPGWSGVGGGVYGHVVCLNVNAKNPYGGYVGNRPVFFMLRDNRVVDAQIGDGRYMDVMVRSRCGLR